MSHPRSISTWTHRYSDQVRGFCVNKSNRDVFDHVNVYGNIYDSDIHHNNFGVYTYGHQQGDWRRNKMHNNKGYGFDPHDDSDFLTIHDNEVYDNGYHGIIASKRCNGVSIQVRRVWCCSVGMCSRTRRKISRRRLNERVSFSQCYDNHALEVH